MFVAGGYPAAAQRSVFKEIVGLMSNLMPDLPLPFLGAISAPTRLSTGTPFLGHVGDSPSFGCWHSFLPEDLREYPH